MKARSFAALRDGDDWIGFGVRLAASLAYLGGSIAAARVIGAPDTQASLAIALVAALLAPPLIAGAVFELRQRRRDELERMQQLRAAFKAGLFTVGFGFGAAVSASLGTGPETGGNPFAAQLALPAVGMLAWLLCARWVRLTYR